MNNQRRDKRWDCEVPVDSGSGTEFNGAQSVDFSRKGMGFVTNIDVSIDKEIAVALDLNSSDDPVLVKGRVVWVQRIPGTSQFRVGVSFDKTLSDGQSRLNEYFEE